MPRSFIFVAIIILLVETSAAIPNIINDAASLGKKEDNRVTTLI